ncbi:MAG TPA: penicillin acylase family protein [Terracidiphilus sp.]|jgi:penicillin amidase
MANSDALPLSTRRNSAPTSRGRKRRWLGAIAITLISLVLLAAIVVALAVVWLRSAAHAALPVLDGDIAIAGLSAPVTVRRDAHGVPHIEAATQQDMFLAQGYITAQDRLWQMDLYRRNANGELAEVMGSSLLRHDQAQRILGFGATARRVFEHLPDDDRKRLESYARGVNLYIAQHPDALPPEFRVLMYKPRPWSGPDSVSIGMMIVDMLDTHWDAKLARERIAAKLNNPRLEADLYPVGSWRDRPPTGEVIDLTQPHPEPPPISDDDERTESRLNPPAPLPGGDTQDLRALLGLPDCDGCQAGSNNWVVAGKHTASGKPLLSNDMHLSLTEPNIWYMADLRAPGYHAAGVTLPGMPMVIAGHNEHVAWGFTALMGDVQDLYVENLDGKGNYQANDGSWKPLAVDHETIHVRGSKDVILEVQSTEHGPLLSSLLTSDARPIALKWALYDTTLNSMPLYAMNVASNWAEFSTALSAWCWPTQNVVYTDNQGHIAYHAVGRIPMRSPAGLFGKPIQHDVMDRRAEWQGYIPFDAMPGVFDPPSGFLATANSRVTTEKSPYPLSLEWVDPYRAERIYKLLQGRDQLTAKDMLATQTDIYSEMDQELGHRFAYAIDHAASDDRLRKAADLMRSWDGRLSTDSAAASLVTQARAALWPLILEPKLGKDAEEYRWAESNFAQEEIIMHGISDWLPPGYKNWDAVLTDAVRKGMEKNKNHGAAPADLSRWAYGSWHVIDIEHPLNALLPMVTRIAGTGSHPLSGDTTTVKQVGRAFGPSQRFTMDWSNIDGSTEDIVLGESGNPYSPYFRDQWNDYYGGTTFALPFTPAAVASQTSHTLRLLP